MRLAYAWDLTSRGGKIQTLNTGAFAYKTFPISFTRVPVPSFSVPSVTSAPSAHVSVQYTGDETKLGVLLSAGSSWVAYNISYISIGF